MACSLTNKYKPVCVEYIYMYVCIHICRCVHNTHIMCISLSLFSHACMCTQTHTHPHKASLVSQTVKNLSAMQEIRKKGMATDSSIFAWRIPWTEEASGLQSLGSQRVRHD